MNCCNFKLNDFTLGAYVFSHLKTNLDKLQNYKSLEETIEQKYL